MTYALRRDKRIIKLFPTKEQCIIEMINRGWYVVNSAGDINVSDYMEGVDIVKVTGLTSAEEERIADAG